MPEITRSVRTGKFLIFSINESVFSKSENRFGIITGRNILGMSFSRWITVYFIIWLVVNSLSLRKDKTIFPLSFNFSRFNFC